MWRQPLSAVRPAKSPQNERRVARFSGPGLSVTTRKIAARVSGAATGCASAGTPTAASGALIGSGLIGCRPWWRAIRSSKYGSHSPAKVWTASLPSPAEERPTASARDAAGAMNVIPMPRLHRRWGRSKMQSYFKRENIISFRQRFPRAPVSRFRRPSCPRPPHWVWRHPHRHLSQCIAR
jgi:hypothetical protein